MMLLRFVFVFALLVWSPKAWALSADFDDLLSGTRYIEGDTITSRGLDFEVVPFGGPSSVVVVSSFGNSIGDGYELLLGNTIGLDFALPEATGQVTLLYDEFGPFSGIEVNGQLAIPPNGLADLDGTTLGGVSLTVAPSGNESNQGILAATGQIDSFVIGGSEFAIDDVNYLSPLLGDYNVDGRTDGEDFLMWQRGSSPNSFSSYDLGVWQIYFGQSLESSSLAVPEPSAATLLLLGCAVDFASTRARMRSRCK